MKQQNSQSVKDATDWYTQLTSGDATADDQRAWESWRGASPENAQAWQRVEEITRQFARISPAIGLATLDRKQKRDAGHNAPASTGRRRALKHLGIILVAGSASWMVWREQPWQALTADFSTGVGESRKVVLEDGTQLYLNTASAADVSFDAEKREVTLIKGEVLIETGHEQRTPYRPFSLKTRHGTVVALGTRFSVRAHDADSRVNVFEGAVRIIPYNNPNASLVLKAGEATSFSSAVIASKEPADFTADAWTQGFIIVDKMPLGKFLEEIGRYRKGRLFCDSKIAGLLISGSFPIADPDAVLTSLTRTLPIRIETFTRYWITINPA